RNERAADDCLQCDSDRHGPAFAFAAAWCRFKQSFVEHNLHSSSAAEFDTARDDGGSCPRKIKRPPMGRPHKEFRNNYGFFGVTAGAGRTGAVDPELLGAGAAIPLSVL